MALQIINQFLSARVGRGRGGIKPILITLHIQDGYGNPWGYFTGASADCTIWNPRSDTGTLVRYLNDTDTPWTNGDITGPDMSNPVIAGLVNRGVTNSNAYCLTIEHEGKGGEGFTPAQVERTAQICAYWCKTWNIPADRTHIIGHYQIGNHKYCPGVGVDWDKIVSRTQQILAGATGEASAPVEEKPVVENSHEFKETGFWVVNGLPDGTPINFYKFWTDNGGLAIFGYPTSPAYIDDKTKLVTQRFERAYFEYHPENKGTQYEVQLRLLGNQFFDLTNNYASLQSQLNALQLKLTDNSSSTAEKDKQINSLTAQVTDLTNKVIAIGKKYDDANRELYAKQASIDALTKQVADLQAQIEELKKAKGGTPQPTPPTPPSGGVPPVNFGFTPKATIGQWTFFNPKGYGSPGGGMTFIGESGSGGKSATGFTTASGAINIANTNAPNTQTDMNDAAHDGGNLNAQITGSKSGDMWVSWRNRGPKTWQASTRHNLDKSNVVLFYGIPVDYVGIAYCEADKKLYCAGNVIADTGHYFAIGESIDNGKTWANIHTIATNSKYDTDVQAQVVCDSMGNIFVAGRFDNVIIGAQRINGAWQQRSDIIGYPSGDWWYGRFMGKLCADGQGGAYYIANSPKSLALVKFDGTKWNLVSDDILKGTAVSKNSITATPDGRIWVAYALNASLTSDGIVYVTASADSGKTFTSPVMVMQEKSNSCVALTIDYNPYDGKVYVDGGFNEFPRFNRFVKTL